MPNSLKTKLSKLRYQGKITDEEYRELIDKLEGHDEALKIQYQRMKGEWKKNSHCRLIYCSRCGFDKYVDDKRQYDYCPWCGAKMEGEDETNS